MVETLLGGLMGGIFRIIPEVLKWMDRKDERKHELSLQDKALAFQELSGKQRLDEIGAQAQAEWNTGALDALNAAIQGQAVKTGIGWVDAISSTVRPVITYWFMALYCAAKVAIFISAMDLGVAWTDAVKLSWTGEDMAIWSGIINFWFLSRVFERVK